MLFEAKSAHVSVDILGAQQTFAPRNVVVQLVIDDALSAESHFFCVSNTHQVVLGYEDSEFREIQNSSAYAFSDSTILTIAGKLLGGRLDRRWTCRGFDLFVALLEGARNSGVRIGFYGGTTGRLNQITTKVSEQLPGLQVVYAYSPPFRSLTSREFSQVVSDIKAAEIDLLFVGIGCPKQEQFMYEVSKEYKGVAMIGIGAAFDFYAGAVRPSPSWVHKVGLEWLYRLVREPRRLWRRYVEYNSKFLWHFGRQLVRERRNR